MQLLSLALFLGCAAAQTLNIPTRSGFESLPQVSRIPRGETRNYRNKEFDRNMACREGDTGTVNAVFVLEDGATIENVIIGGRALEGIHCEGSCTVRNAWFRDVCEDAVSVLGSGDALIVGGGAQNAEDKVIQHNGRGTVTIRDYTVVNVGKLYRSCGDCTGNASKSPRNVIVERVRANGLSSGDLVGINSNFGDRATISGSCGSSHSGRICQEWRGVDKGQGSSTKVNTLNNCLGAQGKTKTLPRC